MQPPSDIIEVNFIDTFSIDAYSQREDSVRTDRTALYLLGSINDPVFGLSKASFCTQINLPPANVDFGSNVIIDSLVLSLAHKGFYGNDKYINPVTVKVYEIDEDIALQGSYFSNHQVKVKKLLALKKLILRPTDTVVVDGQTYSPHIRIPLDNNLGKEFVEAAALGKLQNNSTFKDYFKGLYVDVEYANIGGVIYYFDLLSSISKVTFYYRTSGDTLSFDFPIDDQSERFNVFKHNYLSASNDLIEQLNLNSPVKTNRLFLQTRAGIKVNFSFPTIKEIEKDYKVIINKAELVFRVDESDFSSSIYPLPSKLALVKLKEDGSYAFMPDQTEAYFDGEYDADRKEYSFVISKYIQNLLLDSEISYGLSLFVAGSSSLADRVVLHGTNSEISKPKLKISFTKIK